MKFDPKDREEVNIVRRPTNRQILRSLVAESISCEKAAEIYTGLQRADPESIKLLGCHIVQKSDHESLCPFYDPGAVDIVGRIIKEGFPS